MVSNVVDLCSDTGIASFGDAVAVAKSEYTSKSETYEAADVLITDNIFTKNLDEVSQYAIGLFTETATWSTKDITITNNIVHDWASSSSTNLLLFGAGSDVPQSVTVSGNDFQESVESAQIIDTNVAADAGWSFLNNKYETQAASSAWFDNNGTSQSLAQWSTATGDTSTASVVSYTDDSRDILSYALTLGHSTLDEFMQEALDNNKANWDWRYTAYAAVDHVRAGFDKAALTSGNVSTQYLAFRDGSSSSYLSLSAGGQFIVLQT